MRLHQLVLYIAKCPEEYTGSKHIEMPENGGSIGRAPGSTLHLIDHNRFISGTHCLLSVYGDTYYISDVSTNGTMVNGTKILKNQPISIVDGDTISLGQYEIGVGLEKIVETQDIAVDIAPDRVSTDPLVNLGEAVVEEEEKIGALEELFMETKQDDVDLNDPIAHLKFSMQLEDDHLIRDEEKPQAKTPQSVENIRQVVDDSFSIHSEFDIPSLIPEDWMGGEGEGKSGFVSRKDPVLSTQPHSQNRNNTQDKLLNQESFAKQDDNIQAGQNKELNAKVSPLSDRNAFQQADSQIQPHSKVQTESVSTRQPESAQFIPEFDIPEFSPSPAQTNETAQKWEEVTQAFSPTAQPLKTIDSVVNFDSAATINSTERETDVAFLNTEQVTQPESYDVTDISQAFYEGLGVSKPELLSSEALLFKQMGTCLRLCIEKLQKELHEVEQLKDETGLGDMDANITELMLTLNSQQLLSPNELVEQMLDELSDHQVTFNKALNELLLEQSESNDPVVFARELASKSLFNTKSKLWSAYLEFYSGNRRQLNESSLKGLIKKSYTKALRGSHA